MSKKFLFVFHWVMMSFFGFSQTTSYHTPALNFNQIPPSPEVATLGKFTELPVNLSTGLPEISLPIYTIKVGSYEIPISLSYHAGGIRVEEIASSCGLGWSLNAGGSISRVVRGNRDEYPTEGYLDNPHTYASIKSLFTSSTCIPVYGSACVSFLNNVANNQTDLEPDAFQYNIPNASGAFFLSKADKKAYPKLFNNYSIQYDRSTFLSFNQGFSQWTIIDDKGIKYFFGKNLSSTTAYIENTTSLTSSNGIRGGSGQHYTAWYLTEIVLPNNADTIHFEYEPVQNKYTNKVGETLYVPNMSASSISNQYVYSEATSNTFQIKSITGRFGKVGFNYNSTQRSDLIGSRALNDVEIDKPDGSLFKRFVLRTSYFLSDPPSSDISGSVWYDAASVYRLKLDAVDVYPSTANSTKVQTYSFEYDYDPSTGRKLPFRLSNSQDFWGYFNGQNNTTLVPRYPDFSANMSNAIERIASSPVYLPGARRAPSFDKTKIGVLTKVIYPTGGSSVFDYEQNEAYTSDFDHEMGIPGEGEVPEQVYASLSTNTILTAGYNSNYVEATFETSGLRRNVNFCKIDIDPIPTCDGPTRSTYDCPIKVELITPSGETKLVPLSGGTFYFWCTTGQYKIRLTIVNKNLNSPYAINKSVVVTGPAQQSTNYNKKIGGLRIKTITQVDGVGSNPAIVKEYYYQDAIDQTKSSGFLNYNGQFHYNYVFEWTDANGPRTENAFTRTSASNYPLVMQSGSAVIYSNVQVLQQNATEKFKSAYKFNVVGDNYAAALTYPLGPVIKNENLRGQLVLQTDYKFNGVTFEPLKETFTDYVYNTRGGQNTRVFEGVKLFALNTGSELLNDNRDIKKYEESTDWVYSKVNTETYYSGAPSINKTVNSLHDNPLHGLVTETNTENSKLEVLRETIAYVQDYVVPAGTLDVQSSAIKALKDKNLFLPIEVLSTKKLPNGTEYVTAGTLTYYDPATLQTQTVFKLELATPILLSSFVKSSISASGIFSKDSRYAASASIDLVDIRNNVLQLHKTDDVATSFIWDYNKQYPIAKVENSGYGNCAYTSFESDGVGGWSGVNASYIQPTGGLTGDKYYNSNQASFSLSKTSLTASTLYAVTYWSKNGSFAIVGSQSGYPKATATIVRDGNTWTQYEHLVTGQATITVTGSGGMDELRLYPKGALMTTFTYSPLVGISTQTDPNGRTTYYEYDSFGRLWLTKDKDGKIVKKFCYNYAGQVENCN